MKKSQDNGNTPDNTLKGKSLEELWELLLGKMTLDEQRAKNEARKLKPDYREDAINLYECPICGCDNVPNVELDVALKSNNKRLLSVRVNGAQCNNPSCLESFYDGVDLKAIEDIEFWLNMREHHHRIIPFHLLSTEMRESIARAMHDEDDDSDE